MSKPQDEMNKNLKQDPKKVKKKKGGPAAKSAAAKPAAKANPTAESKTVAERVAQGAGASTSSTSTRSGTPRPTTQSARSAAPQAPTQSETVAVVPAPVTAASASAIEDSSALASTLVSSSASASASSDVNVAVAPAVASVAAPASSSYVAYGGGPASSSTNVAPASSSYVAFNGASQYLSSANTSVSSSSVAAPASSSYAVAPVSPSRLSFDDWAVVDANTVPAASSSVVAAVTSAMASASIDDGEHKTRAETRAAPASSSYSMLSGEMVDDFNLSSGSRQDPEARPVVDAPALQAAEINTKLIEEKIETKIKDLQALNRDIGKLSSRLYGENPQFDVRGQPVPLQGMENMATALSNIGAQVDKHLKTLTDALNTITKDARGRPIAATELKQLFEIYGGIQNLLIDMKVPEAFREISANYGKWRRGISDVAGQLGFTPSQQPQSSASDSEIKIEAEGDNTAGTSSPGMSSGHISAGKPMLAGYAASTAEATRVSQNAALLETARTRIGALRGLDARVRTFISGSANESSFSCSEEALASVQAVSDKAGKNTAELETFITIYGTAPKSLDADARAGLETLLGTVATDLEAGNASMDAAMRDPNRLR